MLYTFLLFTATTLSVAVKGLANPSVMARNASTTLTCGNPSEAIPFLREFVALQGDHLYTANPAEIQSHLASHNAVPEGEAGYVFNTQVEGTVPFYRLFNNALWDHYYIISPTAPPANSGGYAYEGIACYVYPTQVCGSIPLYRSYSNAAGDHFYTTSLTERNIMVAAGGYVYEGIAAYVLPSGATGCTPK